MRANAKNVYTRYANSGDISFLQDLEILVDWHGLLKDKDHSLIVAEKNGLIGAYAFSLSDSTVFVSSFHYMDKFGQILLGDLIERTKKIGRQMIMFNVREDNLTLQLFLHYNQFELLKSTKKEYILTRRV